MAKNPEAEIIKLLTKRESITSFPKLQPDIVTELSKSIANILYVSSTKDVFLNAGRRDVLLLLQKWCCKSVRGHNGINSDNYDCYLSCLHSPDGTRHVKKESCAPTFVEPDIVTSVEQHCYSLNQLHNKKQELLDIVKTRDDIQLGNILFNNSSTYITPPNLNTVLCLIKDMSCCNTGATVINEVVDPSIRTNRIKFLYALLNLIPTNLRSLLTTLEELGDCSDLFDYETEFLEYLWRKSDEYKLPEETKLMLLKKYSFLYEKPLIQICTYATLGKPAKECIEYINFQSVLKVAVKHLELRVSIISALYELYAYSNYNEGLVVVFNLLDGS